MSALPMVVSQADTRRSKTPPRRPAPEIPLADRGPSATAGRRDAREARIVGHQQHAARAGPLRRIRHRRPVPGVPPARGHRCQAHRAALARARPGPRRCAGAGRGVRRAPAARWSRARSRGALVARAQRMRPNRCRRGLELDDQPRLGGLAHGQRARRCALGDGAVGADSKQQDQQGQVFHRGSLSRRARRRVAECEVDASIGRRREKDRDSGLERRRWRKGRDCGPLWYRRGAIQRPITRTISSTLFE